GIGFSNAPGQPKQIYGQNFFPLARPVQLAPGDCIDVQVTARLVDSCYVWGWNSSIRRAGAEEPETSFRQSSFGAKVMSPASLQSRSSTFVPAAVEAHDVDRFCLSLVDGSRAMGEIAEQLRARFPDRFPSFAKALDHVASLTARYR
ncbi:MAG TPA: hypothetical protein VM326_07410, partial [Sphingomicrobium sp.]|nr:hypothetical protein [Sphingomicrobium sp.]